MIPIQGLTPLIEPPKDDDELFAILKEYHYAIEEMQRIFHGSIALSSHAEDEDSITNLDTCIIDVGWEAGGSTVVVVDNPLGRVIKGAFLLAWMGSSKPYLAYYTIGFAGVTAGSTTVTYSGSNSTLINGIFVGTGDATVGDVAYPILSIVASTSFELGSPWGGATASISGLALFSLGPDQLTFDAPSTTNGVWSRWIIF